MKNAMQWRNMFRVAIVFAAALAATAVASGEVSGAWLAAFYALLAQIAGFALTLLGVPASSDGAIVGADKFSAIIVSECAALEVIILFGAAVLVYPTSIGARLRGLLLGVATLFALNITRIVSLILIGIHYPDWLEDTHLWVWQPAMAIAAIGLWMLWHWGVPSATIGKAVSGWAIGRYQGWWNRRALSHLRRR